MWNYTSYPSAVLVIPKLQLENLVRQGLCVFLRITWGHGGKNQDALTYG